MNLFILTSATDRSLAAITSAANTTPLVGPDDFPQLVLGTTEPLTVYHLSAASTYESWSADPTYTITATLGLLSATGLEVYAQATLATAVSNGKSGDLALTTQALIDAARLLACRPRQTAIELTLQITVTDPSGNRRAYAQLPVLLNFRVPDFLATPSPAENYLTAAEIAAAYQQKADARFYPTLVFFGQATDEQIFGYFYADQACKILGAQIAAQTAPAGSDLTLDLVDSAGTEQTKIATLAAGAQVQRTAYATALEVAAGSYVRAKLKTVGSTTPGGYLTVNLICQPNL